MPEHHMKPVQQNRPGQPSFRASLLTQLQTTQRLLNQSRAKRRERGLSLNNSIKARWPVVLLGSAAALGFWFCSAAPAFASQHKVTAHNNGNNGPDTGQNNQTLPHRGLEASLRWLIAMLLAGRSLLQAVRLLVAFFTAKKSA